jgi:hypothetical protein
MLQRFRSLSDDDLLTILGPQRDTYTPGAIEVAGRVAEERGIVAAPTPSGEPEPPRPEEDWPFGVGGLYHVPWPQRRVSWMPGFTRALLISPLVAVAILTLAFVLHDLDATLASGFSAEELLHGAFWIFVLLAPGAYVAEFVLGWPCYLILQETNRLQPRYLIGAGAVIGVLFVVGVSMVSVLFFWFLDDLLFLAVAGVAAGGSGGAVFWLTALRATGHASAT